MRAVSLFATLNPRELGFQKSFDVVIKNGKLTEIWHNVPNSDMLAQINAPTAK